ncbi:Uncharacterized protein APZ42_016604 [Daphnia magna]|uniref:Uncharacterized protein n=1 Tax=Daphnia magna TaxID=35525 RepID=A0A165AI10_9CRUS|nr:Uncharacterized protein APZ42_016604 [Daphnia magna]
MCFFLVQFIFFILKAKKKKRDPERPSLKQWQSVYCHRAAAHATVSPFSLSCIPL